MMKNEYETHEEITIIFLNKKDGTKVPCIIDTDMLPKVSDFEGTWYPTYSTSTRSYYARGHILGGNRSQRGRSFGMHRYLMDSPKDLVVDHVNRNTLDNRISNLRNCTILENNKNAKDRKSLSGIPGIYWREERKKWRLYFKVNGSLKHFGYFANLEDAIQEKNKVLSQKSS